MNYRHAFHAGNHGDCLKHALLVWLLAAMQRKPGGYRQPTLEKRILSVISEDRHREWFQQIWSGLPGASTRKHPAPYPVELAERLIRMFSFVDDTVLDPFMGTASSQVAAARCGRNSIGVEVDPVYFRQSSDRLRQEVVNVFGTARLEVHPGSTHSPGGGADA